MYCLEQDGEHEQKKPDNKQWGSNTKVSFSLSL